MSTRQRRITCKNCGFYYVFAFKYCPNCGNKTPAEEDIRQATDTKRAIGPVLATLILIGITLIAAILIALFVFGLIGSFTTEQTTVTITSNTTSYGYLQNASCQTLLNNANGNLTKAQTYVGTNGDDSYALLALINMNEWNIRC